jgi:lipopolysaccharide/colanic/teichoic acid biosynthesis glycosyltransferase
MQLRHEQRAQDDRATSAAIPYPFAKRILDATVSAVSVLLLSPVLLLAAAAAALASRGQVFHRHERVSRGRTFQLLKFRTVRRGIPGEPRLVERDPANLTWAGRYVLKPAYFDELPQLINVLRGDISLVGPRPWPPDMVAEQVRAGCDYRLHVMAGLTGPAQLGKGVVTEAHYEGFDLEYVEKCRTLGGLALVRYDLGILLKTLRVVARSEGLKY